MANLIILEGLSRTGKSTITKTLSEKYGFKNINRVEFSGVNLDVLQQLAENLNISKIDRQLLIDKNLIHKNELFKVLGRGEITASLEVHANKFSETAKASIEKAGGSTHTIGR